jgi:hypothetical protein
MIDSERVQFLFHGCLAKEDQADAMKIRGIGQTIYLDLKKLEGVKKEVSVMLAELPDNFKKKEGEEVSGWSLLNACEDRNGNQWTGFHQTVEQLFVLGMGIGKVEYTFPREIWSMLPGSMPYYTILP